MPSAIIKLTTFLFTYFTVTLHFTVFFPDFTAIIVVPFFFAVIWPFELTEATFELLDLYVIFSVLVNGERTGFSVAFCFLFSLSVLATLKSSLFLLYSSEQIRSLSSEARSLM